MEHIYIITNEHKDPGLSVTGRIKELINSQGKRCTVQVKEPKELLTGGYTDCKHIPDDVDCVLVLGGDGTMLQAARDTIDRNLPLLGVNLGTLGYLAEVEKSNLEAALKQLFADEFTIEERMMLTGRIMKDGKWLPDEYALNDIALTRKGPLQIIHFDITVNGQFLKEYGADGILVATPTGSTGYNLSAGGPIVEPGARIILMTPICPHTLHSRSIVLSSKDEIGISVSEDREGKKQTVEVAFDGGHNVELTTGDRICIKRSQKVTRIIRLNKVSFLEILHKKMSEQ